MSHQAELRISPLGLDATGRKVLQVVTNLLTEEDGITCRLLADGDAGGHLVILDMESPDGRRAFPALGAGQVKLLLGGPPASGRNIAHLAKPVQVGALRELMSRICRRMQAQLDASFHDLQAPEVPPSPSAPAAAPATDLLARLRTARREGSLLAVRVKGQDLLLVSGAARACAFLVEDGETRLFAAAPADIEIREIDTAAFEAAAGTTALGALDNLLWQCAVHAAPDRLPPGIDEQTPVRLRAWPNFTRQGFRNDYFRIAATLARQPASCAQLIEATGFDRRSVVGFLTACEAVELLVVLPPEGADAAKVTPLHGRAGTRRRGLLARLAERLGLAQA